MFGKRKRTYPGISYDPETMRPVLKCSICTGEQVAGFKDIQTGHFTDVMLIKGQDDLDMFMKIYNLSSITKEW